MVDNKFRLFDVKELNKGCSNRINKKAARSFQTRRFCFPLLMRCRFFIGQNM